MYKLFCQRPQAYQLFSDIREGALIVCHRDIVGRNWYACGYGCKAGVCDTHEYRSGLVVDDFLKCMGPVTEPEGVHAVKNEARLPVPEIVEIKNGTDHRRRVSGHRPADPVLGDSYTRSQGVEDIFFWNRAFRHSSR